MTRLPLVAAAALALAAAALFVSPRTVLAEDVRTELRLLTAEGKFTEAHNLLAGADDAVKNDRELRLQLLDTALRYARQKEGPTRTKGLDAGVEHAEALLALDPADVKSAAAGIEASTELADLLFAAKNADGAKAAAGRGVALGEACMKVETPDPGIMETLAAAHDKRAEMSHKVNDMEQIIGDYGRAAELLEKCAATSTKAAVLLAGAAGMYLKQSQFVSDHIPIPDEHRDEEAAKKALAAAKRACEVEGAPEDVFTQHLLALRMLGTLGMDDDAEQPYMKDVQPVVEGLALQMPRGKVWKMNRSDDWTFWATREFEGETKSVEIMIKVWDQNEAMYGRMWSDVKGIAEIRYEGQQEKFSDVNKKVPLHRLGEEAPDENADPKKKKKKSKKKPKKGKGDAPPEVWHYRIIGKPTGTEKPQQLAEFFWKHPKIDISYQVRVLDWGTPWGIDDADVALFLRSAFGDQWPEPADDKKAN